MLLPFPGGACARNSLEKCATRSPNGRYRVLLPLYTISLGPLYHKLLRSPLICLPVSLFFFSASHSVNCIGLKRYRFSPLLCWGWRTCSHTLQITTDRGMVLVVHPMANELFSKQHVTSERLDSIPSNVCLCYARVPKLKLTWGWFNGTWRCLWGVYKQFAHLAKRYHVSGFTSWCSLFFTARRSEKYDTLPMTSTAGVNWLPPADLVPDLIWYILRHNFAKCYSGIYFIFHSWSRSDRYNTPCSLSYSVLRQEYLPHVHRPRRVWMIFPI